jgi:hypothetical protein
VDGTTPATLPAVVAAPRPAVGVDAGRVGREGAPREDDGGGLRRDWRAEEAMRGGLHQVAGGDDGLRSTGGGTSQVEIESERWERVVGDRDKVLCFFFLSFFFNTYNLVFMFFIVSHPNTYQLLFLRTLVSKEIVLYRSLHDSLAQ